MSVTQNSLDSYNAALMSQYLAQRADFLTQAGIYHTNYITAVQNGTALPPEPAVPVRLQYAYDANGVPQPTSWTDPALTALLAPPVLPPAGPPSSPSFGGITTAAQQASNDELQFRMTMEGLLNRVVAKLGA